MLSLESPHRGDSKEYAQHTIFNIKQEMLQYVTNAPKVPYNDFDL